MDEETAPVPVNVHTLIGVHPTMPFVYPTVPSSYPTMPDVHPTMGGVHAMVPEGNLIMATLQNSLLYIDHVAEAEKRIVDFRAAADAIKDRAPKAPAQDVPGATPTTAAPNSHTLVKLDVLLFADIQINALSSQVVERDIELLTIKLEAARTRLTELESQKKVLYGKVSAAAGMSSSDVMEIALVDMQEQLVAVR